MFNENPLCCNDWIGFGINPAFQELVACGYDPDCYISTAKLVSSSYATQPLIEARLGGLIRLIESVDDAIPPVGDLKGSALLTYNSVIQNVTTEINGYLASIYPIPLAQTGTVAVLRINGVSADGLGTVTSVEVLNAGNYQVAPNTANNPAYLRHIDDACNDQYFGCGWQFMQKGSGLQLTVAYTNTPYSDESGTTVQAQTINGAPTISVGGQNYCFGQLVVLVGGQSFPPAKIREASLVLICHSLYQRRLAPDEKNPFYPLAKMWREFLIGIGEGENQLDGTYKRNFSVGASWNQNSVLFGSNSL